VVKLKFAHKIIAVSTALVVLALMVSTSINYFSLRTNTQENLNRAIDEIGTSVSTNIANWLTARLQIVSAIAENTNADDETSTMLVAVQQAVKAGNLKNTYIGLQSTGQFILDDIAVQAQLPADFDARSRPWYLLAKNEQKPSFTETYQDATTKLQVLSAVAPIQSQGQFIGVAGGDIFLDEIADILNQIDFLDLGYAYLTTAEGKILSHPDQNMVNKRVTDLLGEKPHFVRSLNEINDKQIVSFVPISGIASVDWYVGVVLDKEKAYQPLIEARNTAILVGIISLLVSAVLLHLLFQQLMKPILHLNKAVYQISQGDGDLTQRVNVESDDEIGQLSENFNHFIETIHQSMQQVQAAAHILEEHIGQVRDNAESGIQTAEQQTARGHNVAQSVNELSQASNEISLNADSASKLTSTMQQQSSTGMQALGAKINAMNELSDTMTDSSGQIERLSNETQNIVSILDVIMGVSSQTNLLALNAAIEAARAGDAGRGFAVVADEVRQLAQRTQEAASEIEHMIENLQQGTVAVVQSMEKSKLNSGVSVEKANVADQQMHLIHQALTEVDNENHAVADATKQQGVVINSIDEDINGLMELTKLSVENLQLTHKACDGLQQEFADLNRLVGQFKV